MKATIQIFTILVGLTVLFGQGCGKSSSPFSLDNILNKNNGNGGIYGGIRGLNFSASEVYSGARTQPLPESSGYNYYFWKRNTTCPRANPTGPAPELWISGFIQRSSSGTNFSPSLCSTSTPLAPPSLFKRLAFDSEIGVFQDKVYFLNNDSLLNSLDIRVAQAYCSALYPTNGPRNQGFAIVIYSKKLSGIGPYFARIREGRLVDGILTRKTVEEFPVALNSVGNLLYVSGMEDISSYVSGSNVLGNSPTASAPAVQAFMGEGEATAGISAPSDRDPGAPLIDRPGVPKDAINLEISKATSTAVIKATIEGTDYVLDLKCVL